MPLEDRRRMSHMKRYVASPRTRGAVQRGTSEVLTQYREAVVGSLIGVAIEFANYFLFRHSVAGSMLALSVAIIGLLLALLRSALQIFIQESLVPVEKLAEVVDLQTDSNVAVV